MAIIWKDQLRKGVRGLVKQKVGDRRTFNLKPEKILLYFELKSDGRKYHLIYHLMIDPINM